MKSVSFILISLTFFLITSCTKDRTCHCVAFSGYEDVDITFPKVKKKDAQDACKDQLDMWPERYISCELQ